MSKFVGLVHKIENLKKEIDEIQDNNVYLPVNTLLTNTKENKNISEIDKKYEIKNLYTICNKNYTELNKEIIYVNVKREALWKNIRDIQEYLINLGILKETEIKYSQFILEKLEIPEITKEIHFLNTKLEFLERDARKNDIEYAKYEGFFNTIWNKTKSPFKTTKEERKLEAINKAQTKLYATLRFYFDYYKDSLKLQNPYLEECIKVAKLYRESLNNLLDTIDKKILPFLEITTFFLKSLIIKDLVKEKKINENMSLNDIEVPKNIANLKDTEYGIYYTFFENLFHLYTSIEVAFKENILSNLIFFKNDYLSGEELGDIKKKIKDLARTDSGFGTFDWLISIDTYDEEYIYSTDDIKFLNYSESIKESQEKIEFINEKIVDVNKNLDEIEKISNEMK